MSKEIRPECGSIAKNNMKFLSSFLSYKFGVLVVVMFLAATDSEFKHVLHSQGTTNLLLLFIAAMIADYVVKVKEFYDRNLKDLFWYSMADVDLEGKIKRLIAEAIQETQTPNSY